MFTASSPAGNGSAAFQFQECLCDPGRSLLLPDLLFYRISLSCFATLTPLIPKQSYPSSQGNSPSAGRAGKCWVLPAPGAPRGGGSLGSGQDRAECDPHRDCPSCWGWSTPRTGKGQSHPRVRSEWHRGDTAGVAAGSADLPGSSIGFIWICMIQLSKQQRDGTK